MHITRVDIDTVPPLGYDAFHCDERVNLFIGPNASGKSTILRAIEGFYSLGVEQGIVFNEEYGEYNVPVFLNTSDDWPRDSSASDLVNSVMWGKVPLLYIPATRVNLPGMDIFNDTIDMGQNRRTNDSLNALFETRSGIFNGYYLEQVVDWILSRRTGRIITRSLTRDEIQTYVDQSKRNQRQRIQLSKAMAVGYSCGKSVCPEIIRGDTPRNYVSVDPASGTSRTGKFSHPGMGIMVSDDILAEPLYAGVLSSGTQGTLLWVWALALKIALHYLWEDDWQEKPAILLIDEIENHLHPTWQRRVIPALLEHFPQLQIFATTHSPFIVAGLKAGQVHLLKRDENGDVTAATNTEDIVGWTADEILRNMMGVDEPTDQLTVGRANRLRQLREKETLTTEEEDKLNALRRQVSEDLLAKGGPLEVEREHYADLMRDFLRSQQSELTQDGG